MFSALTTTFGSAMRLACRRFLTPQQRRDLNLHLEPVEKLVRVLMIVEAITLLVTTPMGLKLRQTTKPCRIPDPPPQVGAHKSYPETNRIQAAMLTIAAHQPSIDPRVAEREAREKEQTRVAALELQRQRFDDYDPAALTSRFSVIHWTHDPAPRPQPAAQPDPGRRHRPAPPTRPPHHLNPARALRSPLSAPRSRRTLGPRLPRILQRLHPGEARLRRPRPRLMESRSRIRDSRDRRALARHREPRDPQPPAGPQTHVLRKAGRGPGRFPRQASARTPPSPNRVHHVNSPER